MMENKKILILEDNKDFRESLSLEFLEKGFAVYQAESILEIPNHQFNYAIIDLRLKHDNGLQSISKIFAFSPQCKIVVLTGYPSLATAVQAIKKGAVNYLTKPVSLSQIEKALFEDQNLNDISESATNFENKFENNSLSLARHEREYIEFILAECNGNITSAAKKLGLHRQSLQRKLRKYPPRF
ncbi:response regulator transcription factor [Spirobacillus cienkowskii]|uniref:response regulator transcription factor n=1 Tax=Spirobacillus cienkowskii TaxID=495820 RepID=UPI0030CE9809